jgi:hypothetical protein
LLLQQQEFTLKTQYNIAQSIATEANRPILQEILKSGHTIKRIKDINSVDSITYLLDTTISTQCRSSESSDSSLPTSESGSLSDEIHNEDPDAIWFLQLQLMAIFAAMSGSTYTFPVQFDQNAAW